MLIELCMVQLCHVISNYKSLVQSTLRVCFPCIWGKLADLSWPWLVQLVGCSSTPHVSHLPTGQPGHTLTVMTEAQERASLSVQPLFKPLLVSQMLTSTGEITRLSPRSRGYSRAPCSCRRALQSHMAKSVGAGKG